jgi:hypothetical protein
MTRTIAFLSLLIAALSSSTQASSRTALPGVGLSIMLPSGWDTVSTADSSGHIWHYMWLPKDTAVHVRAGVFLYEGLSADSDSVANWPYEMSYAQKINIEFDACGGSVYSWTNYEQDGLSASYLNSIQVSGSICDTTEAWHQRYFASSSYGWEVYLAGDTATVSDGYAGYTRDLDSIQVLREWVAGVSAVRSAVVRFSARQDGSKLVVRGPAGATGWLFDTRGRSWGRLELDAQGTATRSLEALPSGHYVMRASWRDGGGTPRTGSATFFVAR